MCARTLVNYMLSWPSSPGPRGRRHEAHRRASDPYVEAREVPGRVRGGPQTLANSMWKRHRPTKIVTRASSTHIHPSTCREKGMCARTLVNYMLSWPSPGPRGRRHEAHRRASDPYVEAREVPGRVRGGSQTLANSMWKRHRPTKIVIRASSTHIHPSTCREKGMCARTLVNYMLSWPSPGPRGRRHEAHRRASDPYVEAPEAPRRV